MVVNPGLISAVKRKNAMYNPPRAPFEEDEEEAARFIAIEQDDTTYHAPFIFSLLAPIIINGLYLAPAVFMLMPLWARVLHFSLWIPTASLVTYNWWNLIQQFKCIEDHFSRRGRHCNSTIMGHTCSHNKPEHRLCMICQQVVSYDDPLGRSNLLSEHHLLKRHKWVHRRCLVINALKNLNQPSLED